MGCRGHGEGSHVSCRGRAAGLPVPRVGSAGPGHPDWIHHKCHKAQASLLNTLPTCLTQKLTGKKENRNKQDSPRGPKERARERCQCTLQTPPPGRRSPPSSQAAHRGPAAAWSARPDTVPSQPVLPAAPPCGGRAAMPGVAKPPRSPLSGRDRRAARLPGQRRYTVPQSATGPATAPAAPPAAPGPRVTRSETSGPHRASPAEGAGAAPASAALPRIRPPPLDVPGPARPRSHLGVSGG